MSKFLALQRAAWLDALVYRAELAIWILAGALPLVMLGAWLPLAEAGLIGSYTQGEFVAYYLGALTVRQFTGVWIIWDMEREVRMGELSPHLLRPVHPLLRYLAMALADKPLRALVALPLFAGTMLLAPWARPPFVPLNALALPLAIALAFALYFTMQSCIGLLSFWITQVIAIQELWFGIYSLASGFLIPIDLFPEPVAAVLHYLPFRGLLAFPLELLLGRLGPAQVAEGLALQAAWAAFFFALLLLLWRRGLRQYGADGA
jgi:ABC-2 type transport system permease protein